MKTILFDKQVNFLFFFVCCKIKERVKKDKQTSIDIFKVLS